MSYLITEGTPIKTINVDYKALQLETTYYAGIKNITKDIYVGQITTERKPEAYIESISSDTDWLAVTFGNVDETNTAMSVSFKVISDNTGNSEREGHIFLLLNTLKTSSYITVIQGFNNVTTKNTITIYNPTKRDILCTEGYIIVIESCRPEYDVEYDETNKSAGFVTITIPENCVLRGGSTIELSIDEPYYTVEDINDIRGHYYTYLGDPEYPGYTKNTDTLILQKILHDHNMLYTVSGGKNMFDSDFMKYTYICTTKFLLGGENPKYLVYLGYDMFANLLSNLNDINYLGAYNNKETTEYEILAQLNGIYVVDKYVLPIPIDCTDELYPFFLYEGTDTNVEPYIHKRSPLNLLPDGYSLTDNRCAFTYIGPYTEYDFSNMYILCNLLANNGFGFKSTMIYGWENVNFYYVLCVMVPVLDVNENNDVILISNNITYRIYGSLYNNGWDSPSDQPDVYTCSNLINFKLQVAYDEQLFNMFNSIVKHVCNAIFNTDSPNLYVNTNLYNMDLLMKSVPNDYFTETAKGYIPVYILVNDQYPDTHTEPAYTILGDYRNISNHNTINLLSIKTCTVYSGHCVHEYIVPDSYEAGKHIITDHIYGEIIRKCTIKYKNINDSSIYDILNTNGFTDFYTKSKGSANSLYSSSGYDSHISYPSFILLLDNFLPAENMWNQLETN